MEPPVTSSQFEEFVQLNSNLFQGVHPHTLSELGEFERVLEHPLPSSMKWLLSVHGYSECCGVGNLHEAVQQTLSCRHSINLPRKWLLLNDWGDGGVVLVDLIDGRVCWCDSHDINRLATGEQADISANWFDGYPEWVVDRVENVD
jgi:hypothetical protein